MPALTISSQSPESRHMIYTLQSGSHAIPEVLRQRKLLRRRIKPFFRSTNLRTTSSRSRPTGSGNSVATTVPSSRRRRDIVDEQRWQRHKYFGWLGWSVQTTGSLSRRKSLSSRRRRNRAQQKRLLHLASITLPHLLLREIGAPSKLIRRTRNR